MSDTAIEWAQRVWNPTSGCDKVSPGCDNCYAMTMAKRLKGMGAAKYQTDGDPRTSGPGFGLNIHPTTLHLPLRWRKPKRIFVNSMSDLFHADVPTAFIGEVFATMAIAEQHTFQVLTKRHARMRNLMNDGSFRLFVQQCAVPLAAEHGINTTWAERATDPRSWPLDNVWLGVSVEDQQWADIRIPALLETPTAVRWLSCEPLLGPVDLAQWLPRGFERQQGGYWLYGTDPTGADKRWMAGPPLGWVVAGGESGPGARPMHPDWARGLRDQCVDAGVPFFFKQFGEWWPVPAEDLVFAGDRIVPEYGHDKEGPFKRGWAMRRVGKKAAGRELDGRTWDEYPAGAR